MVIYAVVLGVHGMLNQFGIRLVALLNDVSVWWHILGVLIIVGVLVFAPSHHQSATSSSPASSTTGPASTEARSTCS